MPRIAKALSALAVKNLSGKGLHAVGGVSGLYLSINDNGAKSWILRTKVGTKRSDMGLGSYPAISLSLAHQKATEAKESIKRGIDPIAERKLRRSTIEWTFERCALEFISLHRSSWTNPKSEQQWTNSLSTYAFPVIGPKHVRDITVGDVLAVIEKDWSRINDSMKKVRNRIELILAWAAARGYRPRENPAAWRGNLDAALPKPPSANNREHHPALPFGQINEFILKLRQREGIGPKCLELLIFTCVRSANAREMKWSEIDQATATWTIQGSNMKGKQTHRVPLPDCVMDLINSMPRYEGNDYVFQGRSSNAMSDATMNMLIKRMHKSEISEGNKGYLDPNTSNRIAVVHGFRSTFADWAAECTSYAPELREMALAHSLGNKTQAAYQRGDLFARRRSMMNDWANYINSSSVNNSNVINIGLAYR
jgi:integrase